MASVLTEKAWRSFFGKNYYLPAAFDREHAARDISTPICISLKSVAGLTTPPSINKVEYLLAVSLYDVGFRLFFGRQWLGPTMVSRGNTNSVLQYNQNIYFHTSIINVNIVGVVEIIALTIAPDGHHRRVGCGWTVIRPFGLEGEMPDSSRVASPPIQKTELFHGSPRALYFMDEPIEANQLLKPVSGCFLSYSVSSHKAMMGIMHLIPENIIISNSTIVPGIEEKQDRDKLHKPHLKQEVSCALEGLAVHLQPTIERFEEELCKLMSEDRANRERRPQESLSINVEERRLHVGVHNGWTFVEKPQTFHLEFQTCRENNSLDGRFKKATSSPSNRRSNRFLARRNSLSNVGSLDADTSCLVLKNRIQLNELLQDPLFAVVFTLEYIISESLSDKDRKATQSLARAHTRTVSVRWAVWNPFSYQSTPEVSLALVGGATQAPVQTFVYRLPVMDMQDKMTALTAGGLMAFRFAMGAKDQYLTVPQAVLPQSAFLHGSMLSVKGSDMSEALALDGSFASGDLHKPPSGKTRTPRGMQQQLIQQQNMQQQWAAAGMMYQPSLPVGMSVANMGQLYQPSLPVGISVPSMGQPPVYMPVAYPADVFNESPFSEMRDLPFTQVHQPILLHQPALQSGQSLSRAAYARLYSAGFTPILDRNGEPPEVLDPNIRPTINLARESVDPLQANEIIFQFLAFSKKLSEPYGPSTSVPGTVFFTFQFYCYPQVTTERLLLMKPDSQLTGDRNNLPFILQKLDGDGTVIKGPPGYEVRYYLDPNFMKPGEVGLFLAHLARQTLHIDVWDGDSLLLVGSCSVDMKYLCRGGNEAVQATFELDVVTYDETIDGSGLTGDIQRGGSIRPISTQHKSCGKLHLRIANVGHSVDSKKAAGQWQLPARPISLPGIRCAITGRIVDDDWRSGEWLAKKLKSGIDDWPVDPWHSLRDLNPLPSKTHVIVSQTAANSTYKGGQLSTGPPPPGTKKVRVARAQHLADHHEVASLILSNHKKKEAVEEPSREGDAERLRKLARLNNIKKNDEDKKTTILGYKTEKSERVREFKTIEIYRTQTKHEGILTMLSQNITTEHTIFPSFATAEFFEFVLRNPYSQDKLITIHLEDKELRLVTEAREWRHFKQLFGLSTPLEEGLFSQSTPDCPQIFLRPKEMVHIPFKYQTFHADHSVIPQGPKNILDKPKTDKLHFPQDDVLQTKITNIKFLAEDNKMMAVLRLIVEPQPHVIDQTFRFHHPENSFLKKSIRMPPFQALPGTVVGGSMINQIFVRCSDPNIIVDCKATQPGEPHDIFLKVALGPSPQIKRFFITIYIDPFLSRPIQVWQCFVHALQRVDINCIEGQASNVALLLKGTQATRLVRCFSSHPEEMSLAPCEPFVLAAGTVHELSVTVRPLTKGTKFFFLNVVDVEYHQLVRSWLVCTTCRSPIVSRAFALVLPVGGGKGCSKRITYTNPYAMRKKFKVLTDRADLVQFKESVFELEGGAAQPIGLHFLPVTLAGTAELLVFINDEEDKNEETFRVNVEYKTIVQ